MNAERKEEIEQRLEEINERLDVLSNGENTEEYNQMLDEGEDVRIGNLSYSPSYVLSQVDPVAYSCGLNDFNDEEISNLETEKDELTQELKEVSE